MTVTQVQTSPAQTSPAQTSPIQTSPIQTSGRKQKKNAQIAASSIDDHNLRALGIGIDTARYGHHVTFLREDKQPASPPMTVIKIRSGYAQLRQQIERLQQRFPNAQISLRIDAAGQYAVNLETFLRSLTHLSMKISVGHPVPCTKTGLNKEIVCQMFSFE